MISYQTARTLGFVVIGFFVIGILLMAVSEHIDGIFLTGLGLFFLALISTIIWNMWKVAGWADSKLR